MNTPPKPPASESDIHVNPEEDVSAKQADDASAQAEFGAGSKNQEQAPQPQRREGSIASDGRKPIETILYECRRSFYFAFFVSPQFTA